MSDAQRYTCPQCGAPGRVPCNSSVCPYAPPRSIIKLTPPGCICPPTSEQTCQNPTCPRRNHLAQSEVRGGTGGQAT